MKQKLIQAFKDAIQELASNNLKPDELSEAQGTIDAEAQAKGEKLYEYLQENVFSRIEQLENKVNELSGGSSET